MFSSTENITETPFHSRNSVARLIFKEIDLFPKYKILTSVVKHLRGYSGAKDPLKTDG